MSLTDLSIAEAKKGLKENKFSAKELVSACLKQIKKTEPKVNAYITVCQEKTLKQAQAKDKLIKKDKEVFQKKPLLGIPIALKDIYSTKQIKTTAGSKVLENYIPVYDATVVKKLKKAGAIIIGKTNLDAWAHGASGENSQFGPTHNPWDLKKVPGGSSSGSAAAVAARTCLAAGGTDTGGSIRYPAGFCNLVGLKPTYGRVSRYGIIAMASSLDSIGHLTKTVQDSALVLSVTAGKDNQDGTTSPKKVTDYLENIDKLDLKKIKIGIPKEYFTTGIKKEVKELVEKAVRFFQKKGVRIKKVSLPHTEYAIAAYYIIQPAEVSSNLARYDGIRFGFKRKKFADEAKRRIMLGTYTLSAGYYQAYYLKAMKIRSLISNDFRKAFQEVDLLLTPTSPTPPFDLGEKAGDPLSMYLCDIFMSPASLAGLPALAVPCGFTASNLPVGMQLIAPQFSEDLLFKIGHFYQKSTDWHKKKPVIIK